MANIKVKTTGEVFTGKVVTFPAPCGCDEVTDGLIINGETYTVCDAVGKRVTGIGGVWSAGAQVSVVLDCENKKAYIQNGSTTPALIGAAPAGYGLGGLSTYLTSADDLNNIWQTGDYYWWTDQPQNSPAAACQMRVRNAPLGNPSEKLIRVIQEVRCVSAGDPLKHYSLMRELRYDSSTGVPDNTTDWLKYSDAVGAAPAGYGYGDNSLAFISTTDTDGSLGIAHFDNVLNGMANQSIKQFPIVDFPIVYGTGSGGIATIYKYNASYATVIVDGAAGERAVLQRGHTGWDSWRCGYPRMAADTEYRTTDHYKGEAVYKKVDSAGNRMWRPESSDTWRTELDTSNMASNGIKRIQIVEYTGTGTYGASNPCSVTFDFAPTHFIFLQYRNPTKSSTSGGVTTVEAWTDFTGNAVIAASELSTSYVNGIGFYASTSGPIVSWHTGAYTKKSSDGKTLYWYNTTTGAHCQLNEMGAIGRIMAIG